MATAPKRPTSEVVADNLRTLAETIGPHGARAMARKCGVGEGTIARARDGSNLTLANLDAIANAYGLDAWQLVMPEFGGGKRPRKTKR